MGGSLGGALSASCLLVSLAGALPAPTPALAQVLTPRQACTPAGLERSPGAERQRQRGRRGRRRQQAAPQQRRPPQHARLAAGAVPPPACSGPCCRAASRAGALSSLPRRALSPPPPHCPHGSSWPTALRPRQTRRACRAAAPRRRRWPSRAPTLLMWRCTRVSGWPAPFAACSAAARHWVLCMFRAGRCPASAACKRAAGVPKRPHLTPRLCALPLPRRCRGGRGQEGWRAPDDRSRRQGPGVRGGLHFGGSVKVLGTGWRYCVRLSVLASSGSCCSAAAAPGHAAAEHPRSPRSAPCAGGLRPW